MAVGAIVITGYAIVDYIISLVIALVASLIVNKMFSDPAKKPDVPDVEQGGHLKAKRSTQAALPLIHGTCRVGINQVFVGNSGTDNEYLHIIGTVGEGPVEGIHQESSVDQVFLDDKIYTDYGSNVSYEFFTGTATQNVCSTLNTAISDWTDPLRYTAYIYVKIKYDRDKFNSIPNITVIVEGLKVWDPTDDVTANTDNPALCVYDMLTRPSVRGGFGLDVWNGPEPASPRIDKDSVDDAKDYCTTKGWTNNQPITEATWAIMDNMNLVLPCFRGGLVYSENTFKVLFKDLNEEAVVMSFDEDEVVSDNIESSLKINMPNIFNRPNAVRAKFLSSSGADDGSGKYQIADLVKTDSTALSADGDYRESEVKLYGLNTVEIVGKMLNYHLERLRWGNMVSFTAGAKAKALEPMDLIQLTHTMPGWTDQVLRLTNVSYMDNDTVSLSGVQEHIDLYDDAYDVTTHTWYHTILPNILGVVASVINVSHAETVYYYRERSFTRWKIDFDEPAAAIYPWWDYAEIWLSIGGSSDYRYMTKSTSDYVLDPVEEGEIYYVKIRSVSVSGAKEDFDSCYTVSKTIVGKTSAPSNLSAITAVANGDSVSIYADPVSDPDIEGYEIRLGAAWSGGIFMSFNKNCSLRLNGVRPGTHTFWMSPKDNSGNYSDTPVSATVTVFVPPGFSELATYGSWAWDFNAIGSHDNTEHTTYDTEDALKCSHTSDVMAGTWTSPTQDLNAIEKVRVWGDFRTAFESSDTTWSGVMPVTTDETIDNAAAVDKGSGQVGIPITGHGFSASDRVVIMHTANYDGTYTLVSETTDEIVITATYAAETFAGTEKAVEGVKWEDVDSAADRTWTEIFQPVQAGKLQVTLQHSEDNSNWDEADFFEVLCAEVEARYIKVEITITDPTLDANLYLKELNMLAYEGPQ